MRPAVVAHADYPATRPLSVARCAADPADDDLVELPHHGDLPSITDVRSADRSRAAERATKRQRLGGFEPLRRSTRRCFRRERGDTEPRRRKNGESESGESNPLLNRSHATTRTCGFRERSGDISERWPRQLLPFLPKDADREWSRPCAGAGHGHIAVLPSLFFGANSTRRSARAWRAHDSGLELAPQRRLETEAVAPSRRPAKDTPRICDYHRSAGRLGGDRVAHQMQRSGCTWPRLGAEADRAADQD